jgi:uncharacterized protein
MSIPKSRPPSARQSAHPPRERGDEERRAGRIDLRKLAVTRQSASGEIDLASCERLQDVLAEPVGKIAYRITGSHDTHGWPVVAIALSGVVPLVCQRCLQSFDYPLESETTVRLASSEAELQAWDAEEIEATLAEAPVDRQELIEDELVLSLPYAPLHPPGECPGQAEEGGREAQPTGEPAAGKENPFAVLARLKKRETDSNEE